MSTWPQPLEPVTGPFRADRIDGAAAGMGEHGPATRAIAAAGHVPPDLITGMTLFLLARQPRDRSAGRSSAGSAISGGVWVRERFAIHRPLDRLDPFTVTGEAIGRHVHKGRRYGTTRSRTVDSRGRPVATNLTTGLLSYRPDPAIADSVDGQPADEAASPAPDASVAAANPHLDRLAAVETGQRLGGDELVVTLAMMAARDTASPDNPIHSDPEEARRAGLSRPIAGGSHVLAFALEPLLAAWGGEVLSHGAAFDVRWRAPTEAGAAIVPTATVRATRPDAVEVDLEVTLVGGPAAMVGTVTIPRPPPETAPAVTSA